MNFREAERRDLPQLIALLADDELGRTRESVDESLYSESFEAILRDPNNAMIVAVDGEEVIGMLQLTLIPGLSRRGAWRALIESVRVASSRRGSGVGRALIEFAVGRAREHGCAIVQLTSDKRRGDALRFYASLGFEATHEGLKLSLP